MRLVLLAILVVLQPGCEGCEFSYGALETTGHLVVTGMTPADLVIETCTSATSDDCLVGTITDDGDGGRAYEAYTPSEGYATCSYAHHWLVATGTNCERSAIDITDAAILDRTNVDAVLSCAGSS